MSNLFLHRTSVEIETHRRIQVSVYAYAYEFESVSLVSDGEFDQLCRCVNLSINTRRPDLDEWFRKNFNPATGLWIHNHPELERIKELYNAHYIH